MDIFNLTPVLTWGRLQVTTSNQVLKQLASKLKE